MTSHPLTVKYPAVTTVHDAADQIVARLHVQGLPADTKFYTHSSATKLYFGYNKGNDSIGFHLAHTPKGIQANIKKVRQNGFGQPPSHTLLGVVTIMDGLGVISAVNKVLPPLPLDPSLISAAKTTMTAPTAAAAVTRAKRAVVLGWFRKPQPEGLNA